MKLAGVIFDLDGTLIDSEPNWWVSDRRFVEQFGGRYDEELRNECIGMGSQSFAEMIRSRLGLTESLGDLLKRKDDLYLQTALGKTQVFPEMRTLLQAFQNLPLAVASGSSLRVIEALLDDTGLRDFFGPHVYSSELVSRSKPAPDIFLYAAEKLRVGADSLLVFEDSQHGVEAAKNAHMRVCAIPQVWTETSRSSLMKADLLFREGMREFSAKKVLDWIETTFR